MLQWCVQFLSLIDPAFVFSVFVGLFVLIYHLFCLKCTIAHALEKTKYTNSDLYWKKLDDKYHFSCQFTADLISMNYTDFIITSSFQEVAGK